MNIGQAASKALAQLRRAAPTILSIGAVAGVIGTVVVTSKAAPEALLQVEADSGVKHDGDPHAYTKREAIMSAWPYYIPVIAVGGATIACILCSNSISRKQQASLAAAYLALSSSYKDYKNRVIELFGEEDEELVRTSLAKDYYEKYKYVPDEDKELFYFEGIVSSENTFIDGYFQSTQSEVQNAFYHFNRNFVLKGYGTLNELLKFLHLEPVEYGDAIGWSYDLGTEDGYEWIDYHILPTEIDEGLICNIVSTVCEPRLLWSAD